MAVLDTHWHSNPKVLSLGVEGGFMHAWGISYCDDELTDGFIPTGALPNLKGVRIGIERLVGARMWVPVTGGWQLHDYLKHNRSREQVLAKRAAVAERRNRNGASS
jgi:hypothetical protein